MKIGTLAKSTLLAVLAVIGLSGCKHDEVKELVVTPKENVVPLGVQLQLKAEKVTKKGKVTDVTTSKDVKWRSSNESIATVDKNGLVSTGDIAGFVEITAIGNFGSCSCNCCGGNKFKDKVTIEVKGVTMKSITVTPKEASTPAGLTRSYTATANFSNGQAVDITNDSAITWESSDTGVATVSNEQDSKGQVKTEMVGTSTITAHFDVEGERFTDTATLNVTEATAVSLEIKPNLDNLPLGLKKQFSAIATMSDGTKLDVTNESAIEWSSSETDLATVSNEAGAKGLVTSIDTGWVTISASGVVNGEFVEAFSSLQITHAVITSLTVTPDTESVPVGLAKEFKAHATLSNGDVVDVTSEKELSWSSSDSNVATISNSNNDKGTVTGVAIGEVTITAYIEADGEEITGTAKLAVTEAVATELRVLPQQQETLDTPQVPTGMTKQFKAEALMSNGEWLDVTTSDKLSWITDKPEIATVSNKTGEKGLATGVSEGETIIRANLDKLSAESTLIVTLAHTISFSVDTVGQIENDVNGQMVEYIGFNRDINGLGSFTLLGNACTTCVDEEDIDFIYLSSGVPNGGIEDYTFSFGQGSREPILGALKYNVTFDWDPSSPGQHTTEGVLVWDFKEKVYTLTDSVVVENLYKYKTAIPFHMTVSNKA